MSSPSIVYDMTEENIIKKPNILHYDTIVGSCVDCNGLGNTDHYIN